MISQIVPVVLAFGANLGDRGETIRAAQKEIAALPGVANFRSSSLHETVALTLAGPDPTAPAYLNCVALLDTTIPAEELLRQLQEIEQAHGRTRETRWGPRTLDIDIIQYGGKAIKTETLTVPHPRAHEREFVLAPWLEIDPQAVLLGRGLVARLLAALRKQSEQGECCAPAGGAGCGH